MSAKKEYDDIINQDPARRQRDFCPVIYQDKDKHIARIKEMVESGEVKYAIFGVEICPTTGNEHLQSYVYYTNARTLNSVRKDFAPNHVKARYKISNPVKASDYCKKDKNYQEFGVLPNDKRGQVNEWGDITNDILAGMSLTDLTLKYPEAAFRYSSGIKNMYELHRPKHKFSILEKFGKFNDVQSEIMEYVQGPTHDREIYWIYDPVGGVGKTDMANHLISNNGFLVFGNAKTADVALAWNGENVIFDYSRSQQDHINYGVIEDIKNGRIFSGKYQSCTKLYARPKVIVFANFLPDMEKMSADRWNIKEVSNGKLVAAAIPEIEGI
nr:rep protein [Cressdnaviricota sp.]